MAKDNNKRQEDLMFLAKKRLKALHTNESELREASLEDIRFTYNIDDGQWPAEIRKDRQEDGRPALVSNKLRKFVAQTANRERSQRMSMSVIPIDDFADQATAEVIGGLIRHIEHQSNGDEIYTKAGEQAISGGFGYWRLVTEHADDDTFDQDIRIREIDNQFTVYLHPKREYGFIREGMLREDFEEAWPDHVPSSWESATNGESRELWYEEDVVFIAEYFYKIPITKELLRVIDPNFPEQPQIIDITSADFTEEELVAEGFQIIKRRNVDSFKVKWAKLSGHAVLEEGDWVGKNVPIYEVNGDRINYQGKIIKRSLIRDGKDPQRMYNYWLTSMTETVALVPKVPDVVTADQIEGHEDMWKDSSHKNLPYLVINESPAGFPRQRQQAQIPNGAMTMLSLADNDIPDSIGMPEATLGEPSNERSGRAITQRAIRGEQAVFHFPDNLRRTLMQMTRDLIDIVPKVYDTERIVRIREYEGRELPIKINQSRINPITGEKEIINDISVGKYDVEASVGLYSTRRQEALDFIERTLQFVPSVAPFILDLVFKYNDLPGAKEIEDRIKEIMPALLAQQTGQTAQAG